MPHLLDNYTNVQVPDLTDPQPQASGQVSGGVGGNDLATAIDDHDHSPGRGVGVSLSSLNPDGNLNMDGFGIDAVSIVEHSDDVLAGAINKRAVAFVDGALHYRAGAGVLRQVAWTNPLGNFAAGSGLLGAWTISAVDGSVSGVASGSVHRADVNGLPRGVTIQTLTVRASSDKPDSTIEIMRDNVPVASIASLTASLANYSVSLGAALYDDAVWWLRSTVGPTATAMSLAWWRIDA